MNYELLEKELKKRWKFDYTWGVKQLNSLDVQTNFIYKTTSFDSLLNKIESKFKGESNYALLKNYTLNRWYNFWSAKALESIFCENKHVDPHANSKNKYIDFYIQQIPFDHKTTVFPRGFKKSIPYAISHKAELIQWLYENQSKEQRNHFKNRLFVVLIDFDNQNAHWELKAEILWLKQLISAYLCTFDSQNLEKFSIGESTFTADIIWAIK